ncbi:MAG TPA: hypothetical protein PKA82_05380 [Pyrinomonadaceae bacterium]|nr:hypothetical protein [Pyrinomonadaceae bacterium]
MRRGSTATTFIILFLVTLVSTTQIIAQEANVRTRQDGEPVLYRLFEIQGDQKSEEISWWLMTAFSTTRAFGGFSKAKEDSETDPILISPKPAGKTLRFALDAIVAAAPEYEWSERNGVVNVFPKKDYKILDVRIPLFKYENVTKEVLLNSLQKAPEFVNSLKMQQINRIPIICCGGICSPKPPTMSINLENATVREILNEIVRLNGKSVWRYREYYSSWPNKSRQHYYDLDFMVDYGATCGI